jgi:hypothetical protein
MPRVTDPPAELAPGEYSYLRLRLYSTCASDVSPTSACAQTQLHAESWWALDDSGRRDALEMTGGYGFDQGIYGPGAFPDEGDLSGFPTDPDALRAFVLDRAAPGGASPRPEVTPAPDVPLEEGLLWNSIRDYLGSTQYLNATPSLRAAMLQVLADVPMVTVDVGAVDPAGRAATGLSFHAYDADWEVFADPRTGDFLSMTERYDDAPQETIRVVLVEAAGFTTTDHERPEADRLTIAPVG